jgi:c-di-GMP-binding flagellar brake protein YcgR
MLEFLDCQQSTVIHDVGEGGIGLRLKGAMLESIADKCEITLGDVQNNQGGRQTIRLRITHKAALGNGEHHVGTEFVEISENWRRELRKILLKLQAASAKVIR